MLVLKDITKNYKPNKSIEVEALKGISYVFPEKGIIFIVGKSGSGKSTMLNILGMLDTYDSGDLIIDGKSSKDFSARERDSWRATNIGFVFQEFHIVEKYSIGKNISLALEIAKQPVTEAQVRSVLAQVGLEGFEKRNSAEISGGQRQRVAIARALIKNPRIILADEPTGSLDTENGEALFSLLKELGKEKLVIVISHDMEAANKYSDQIIEIADGKIVASYAGEGNRQVVKIDSNKLDSKQLTKINSLLADNKKVVISRPQTNTKSIVADTAISKSYNINDKKPSLPIKSAAHLSFLNIRSKWMRTFWTVLITMFAVAFFGFADIIAQFNTSDIMVEEIQKQGVPFINVSPYKIDESTFWTDRSRMMMTEELMVAFDEMGIDHIKKYRFTSGGIEPMLLTFQRFFPENNVSNYYSNTVLGVIEVDDLSKLGLKLSAGRMPQNLNEVVITNYQLERYKLFGMRVCNDKRVDQEYLYGTRTQNLPVFKSGVPVNPLNSFDDIYEKTVIFDYPMELDKYFSYKIVGLIDFDLSPYEEVASIKTVQSKTSDAHRRLLRDADYAKSNYLDNYYVLPGFNDAFSSAYPSIHLSNFNFQFEGSDINPSYQNIAIYPLTPDGVYHGDVMFEPGLTREDIASKDPTDSSYSKKQCVISFCLLWDMLDVEMKEHYQDRQEVLYELYKSTATPDSEGNDGARIQAWIKTFEEIAVDLNIFGSLLTVNMNTTVYGRDIVVENEQYEIVGLLKQKIGLIPSRSSHDRFFLPTTVFFEDAYIQVTDSFIIPVTNREQISNALKFLDENGRLEFDSRDEIGELVIIRFMAITARSNDIYGLDVLFKLFVSVFRILSLLFCVLAILLCYSFISNSINTRKKDIGILRSMGASGPDVARIFTIEGILIALLVIMFGILTCYFGYALINKYFILQIGYLAEEYRIISFGIRQVLLMIAVTLGAVAISVIAPIIRIAKKQPVDAIRN